MIADVGRKRLLEIIVFDNQISQRVSADAAPDKTVVNREAGVPLVNDVVGDGQIVDANAAGDFVG